MLDYKKIVDYLVKYRKDQDISQTDLAKKLKYTPQGLYALEKMNVFTTIDKLNDWCDALGLNTLEVILKIHISKPSAEMEDTKNDFEQKRIIKDAKFLANELSKTLDKLA
jgi:transcriptional regulator with XRE-family HTH domain